MLGCLDHWDDPNVIVGTDFPDDAAVFRMPGGDLLIETVDLIAPIVNDPASYGKIACANSLSDVYAMGGRPLTAMNIACFPAKSMNVSILRQVLAGAIEVLREAKCPLVGGHTVADEDFKFGFSVSGVVEGGEVLSIDRARAGQVLLLTKALGTGIVNKAIRSDKLADTSSIYLEAERSMQALNASAARAARAGGATAMTDITGFGLLGHAAQFAHSSGVTFELERSQVAAFDGVVDLIRAGQVAARAKENRSAYDHRVTGISSDDEGYLMFDPQTSGGMLVALPEAGVAAFRAAMADWPFGVRQVGRVVGHGEFDVVLR